jgi:CBS domain-containing protein
MSAETPTHAVEASTKPCRASEKRSRELKIQDVMSREVITATMDDTVFSAAKTMSENNVSCIIVLDDEMVVGILTDKDVLKGIAGNDREFHHLPIGDRMSSPVETTTPDSSIIAAGKIMETKGVKRLPVVEAGRLIGIVSQTDITRGLISISPLEAVADIMTTDVATIDTAATIAEAAQRMSSQGISSLIAVHRNDVAGIITEKDLLRRVVALHKDPTEMQVVDVMSFPIVAVPPSYSILSAAKKMDIMRLHRLIVMTDNHVYGIVTQTDISKAIRNELERQRQQQRVSAAVLTTHIRYVLEDLERLQMLLNETSNLSPRFDWTPLLEPTADNNRL